MLSDLDLQCHEWAESGFDYAQFGAQYVAIPTDDAECDARMIDACAQECAALADRIIAARTDAECAELSARCFGSAIAQPRNDYTVRKVATLANRLIAARTAQLAAQVTP